MIKDIFSYIFLAGLTISFIIQIISINKNCPKVLSYTDIIFSFIMGWVYAIYVEEEDDILTIIKLVFYVMSFGGLFTVCCLLLSGFYWLGEGSFPWSKQYKCKTSKNETK
jgi:hypothetical protein